MKNALYLFLISIMVYACGGEATTVSQSQVELDSLLEIQAKVSERIKELQGNSTLEIPGKMPRVS